MSVVSPTQSPSRKKSKAYIRRHTRDMTKSIYLDPMSETQSSPKKPGNTDQSLHQVKKDYDKDYEKMVEKKFKDIQTQKDRQKREMDAEKVQQFSITYISPEESQAAIEKVITSYADLK